MLADGALGRRASPISWSVRFDEVTLRLCHIRALRYVLTRSFDAMEALRAFHTHLASPQPAMARFYFGAALPTPGLGADARPWPSGGILAARCMGTKQMTSRALRTHSLVLLCVFPACNARPRPPTKLSPTSPPLAEHYQYPLVVLLIASAQLGSPRSYLIIPGPSNPVEPLLMREVR